MTDHRDIDGPGRRIEQIRRQLAASGAAMTDTARRELIDEQRRLQRQIGQDALRDVLIAMARSAT